MATEQAEEESPLIGAQEIRPDEEVDEQPISEPIDLADSTLESRSSFYLFLLSLPIGGLQIVWSVELSNGSPFLLSLGMSKSVLAIVWLAGPMTGVLVQPYVGILSDNCRVSWGKRKPYMFAGAAGTVVSLLFLAWCREMISGILGIFGASSEDKGVKITIITFATIMMWVLDFAINTGTLISPSPETLL